MPKGKPLAREEFDVLAAQLGISGDPAYLDELFSQVSGLFAGVDSLRQLDVSNTEPCVAFVPRAT